MTRISTPSSRRWVAKLCRSVCGPTRLVISAACAASTTMRWSCRVVAMHHALLVPDLPPLTQQGEQICREHGIAIPATLATLDPDQHALAVDIGHPERG